MFKWKIWTKRKKKRQVRLERENKNKRSGDY